MQRANKTKLLDVKLKSLASNFLSGQGMIVVWYTSAGFPPIACDK
jgi:hypothetical protein